MALHIAVHEDAGACGPPIGCALGCASYWCGCRGPYALCFAKSSKQLYKELDQEFNLRL